MTKTHLSLQKKRGKDCDKEICSQRHVPPSIAVRVRKIPSTDDKDKFIFAKTKIKTMTKIYVVKDIFLPAMLPDEKYSHS